MQPPGECTRQEVGQGEQPSLAAIEDVEVDSFLEDLPVLRLLTRYPSSAFEQHANEGVEEVQVLGCWIEGERVDRHGVLPQPDLHVAAVQQRGELPIAVTEVEYDRLWRVVLLGVRDQEVEQEALPAAGRSQHQRVTDVLHVQVEGVGRLVRRLEHRKRLAPQMRADGGPLVPGEQETHVGQVRLEEREPTQVVRAVARDDGQPGVQQVVGLLEQAAVVDRHGLHGFRRLSLERAAVNAVKHEGQGRLSEVVAVDLHLGEGIAQLAHRG